MLDEADGVLVAGEGDTFVEGFTSEAGELVELLIVVAVVSAETGLGTLLYYLASI